MNFADATLGIFFIVLTLNDVGAFEADFATGAQAEILLGRLFHEVVALDVNLATEGQLTGTHRFVLGVIHGFHHLHLSLGIVGNDDFHGVEYGVNAHGPLVEVLAHTVLQQGKVDHIVAPRHTHAVGKHANAFGGVAPAAQARNGGHAGIVPGRTDALLHQFEQIGRAHV